MKLALKPWLALGAVAISSASALGAAFSAAQDFSPSSNPNGTWSYGWSSSLGSAFTLDAGSASVNSLDFWYAGGLEPFIAHNGTTSFHTYGTGQYVPGTLALHPGASGQNSVVRWTAPTTGTYAVNAVYTGLDPFSTTSDVNVLVNGILTFGANLNGYLTTQSYAGTISLSGGDTLDFSVGFGNGNFYNDTTGLEATISAVPDVGSSIALMVLGVAGLFGLHRICMSRIELIPVTVAKRNGGV